MTETYLFGLYTVAVLTLGVLLGRSLSVRPSPASPAARLMRWLSDRPAPAGDDPSNPPGKGEPKKASNRWRP